MKFASQLGLASIAILTAPLVPAQAVGAQPDAVTVDPARFREQWYRGVAEISRFRLEQSRYGEARDGDLVLIYVTEDFDVDKHVKSDRPGAPGTTSVLKLNAIRRFTTGVYDYSMMRSVFTPVDAVRHPRTLKVTTSVQDWCGHVWAQLDLRGDHYALLGHSYFESEGEQRSYVPAALLEDEVWTRIRLAPGALPDGEVRAIPSTFDARLRHFALRPERAVARTEVIEGVADGDGEPVAQRRFTLTYPDLGRTLAISFEDAFPHRITAFEETVTQAGRTLRSRGVRTHTEELAYWNHNGNRDLELRGKLGLER